MQFFISHWHCILPLGGILAAYFLLRQPKKSKTTDARDQDPE